MSQLVVVAFDDEHKADEVLTTLGRLQHDYLIALEDAAVVVRKKDGKIKIKQTHHVVGPAAISGGIWGSLFGLLFAGPLGAIVVGGTGAAIGALSGKLRDIGIDDGFIKDVGDALEPGTSAIFALVLRSTPDRVLEALEPYHGKVVQTSLSSEDEEALVKALA